MLNNEIVASALNLLKINLGYSCFLHQKSQDRLHELVTSSPYRHRLPLHSSESKSHTDVSRFHEYVGISTTAKFSSCFVISVMSQTSMSLHETNRLFKLPQVISRSVF